MQYRIAFLFLTFKKIPRLWTVIYFKNRSLPPPQFCGSMQVPRPWGNRSIRVHGRECPEYRACLFGQKVRQFLGNLALLVSRVLFSGSAEVHWVSRILPGTILHDRLAGQQKVRHCSFHCPQLRNSLSPRRANVRWDLHGGNDQCRKASGAPACRRLSAPWWSQPLRRQFLATKPQLHLPDTLFLLGFAGESRKMPEG